MPDSQFGNHKETIEMKIVKTGAALGADAWGVDVNTLDDSTFSRLYDAWLDNDGVLRIPCQDVTEKEFIRFSSRWGELDLAPTSKEGPKYRPDLPHLTVISNIVREGKAVGGLGSDESRWHTDMSYNETPPKASILHAVQIPRSGGDTGYSNMYRAYEALSETMKARIRGLHCKHDASRNSVNEVRSGYAEQFNSRDEIPGAVHPLVIRHPESGRDALYLGRRTLAFIPELLDDESDALLDELWTHASQEEFSWYQRWRLGDIVVWDNRCTMHRRDALDPAQPRLMNRTQIIGEAPAAAA